jgi:hypothetical protein
VAERDEKALLRSVRSLLNPVLFPSLSFADMKAKEAAHRVRYLGQIGSEIWYLPTSCSRDTITEVVTMLSPHPEERPATRAALMQLWLCTKHEKLAAEDRMDTLAVYARNLAAYPEPAVLAVLTKQCNEARFWPAWSELHSELAAFCGWRSQLITALRSFLSRRKDLP